MVDIPTLVTGLIGGSAISAWIQLTAERRLGRSSRAEILKALAKVEEARWADGTNTLDEFREAARELEVAACLTGVRQDIIDSYLTWSNVAAQDSFADLEDHGDIQSGGSIGHQIFIVTARLARLVSDTAWHPIRSRTGGSRRLKEVEGFARDKLSSRQLVAASRTPWRRHLQSDEDE